MKIVFTGGGTGGHFYPIIAIAQSIRQIAKDEKLIQPQMYFLAPHPYSKVALYNHDITYKKVSAGKRRLYKSKRNLVDLFKTGMGIIKAVWTVFWIYPDVVFSKGGYGSFPVTVAARILRIPVIIHESDSAPGRANEFAATFAKKIAVSYADAGKYFDQSKVAVTGNPVREEIKRKATEGAHEFLGLTASLPTILILGGSQGAKLINDAILDMLPQLADKYQLVHQTGKEHFQGAEELANVVLEDERIRARYKPFAYLNDAAMRMAAGAADLVISRAGSTLFEVANWQIPAIVIPITESNNDHQRQNAYAYARSGAGVVIEENNLTATVLQQEISRILESDQIQTEMKEAAKNFAKPEAARTIAEAILKMALKHEK